MEIEPFIEAAYRQLLCANTPTDQRIACDHFTALIRARNAERTEQEIARLERAKRLK